jgi:hypothetical protein
LGRHLPAARRTPAQTEHRSDDAHVPGNAHYHRVAARPDPLAKRGAFRVAKRIAGNDPAARNEKSSNFPAFDAKFVPVAKADLLAVPERFLEIRNTPPSILQIGHSGAEQGVNSSHYPPATGLMANRNRHMDHHRADYQPGIARPGSDSTQLFVLWAQLELGKDNRLGDAGS